MRPIDADNLLPELENVFKAAGAISSCNHELWVKLASDVIARAPTIDPTKKTWTLEAGLTPLSYYKAGSFTGDSTEEGTTRVIDCGFTPSAVLILVMGDNWFSGWETPMNRAPAYIALATREQPYNSSDTMKAVEIVEGGFAVTCNTWAEFNRKDVRTNYIVFR